MTRVVLIAILSLLIFSIIHFLCKKKKPLKRAFISVISGPLLIIVLNITHSITGVIVEISELSLTVSTALGIPGVSLLLIAQYLFI